jgi:hypothetical protein
MMPTDDLQGVAQLRQARAERKARRSARGASAELPEIRLRGGDLPAVVDAAETALLADRGEAVYQRGGVLARVLRSQADSVHRWLKRRSGAPVIRVLELPYLVERLTRAATWLKYKATTEDWIAVDCPDRVAKTFAARGAWRLPTLSGTIEAPTLRPDGSVLATVGYDSSTGLLYEPGDTNFPAVPERPTREDALDALKVLCEILQGFPFVDRSAAVGSDMAAALTAVLTALIRRSLKSAPLFAFGAPKMGSGKSLLADVVSMIATGRPCSVMSLGEDSNEERKRWLAVLLEGDPVICIDNVEKPLGGSALCSILTQESYRDRVLGVSQTVSVSTAVTLLATGNNLVFDGDLTTRVVPCDLDPHVERPEERSFDVNLYQYVPEHRGELVVAGLTILRAFAVAGMPKQPVAAFGRFEEWSDWVRSSLVWLGTADPCAGRSRIEALDPTRQRLGQLLVAWREALPGRPSTVAEAIRASNENSDLRDALLSVAADRRGEINPRYVGSFLQKHALRIEDGSRFVRGETRGKVATWQVETAPEPGVSGVSGVGSNARAKNQEEILYSVGTDPSNPSDPLPDSWPCHVCGAPVQPGDFFCQPCWSARQAVTATPSPEVPS